MNLGLSRDGRLLFAARIVRMFGYGSIAVILVLYLARLGFDGVAIGSVLAITGIDRLELVQANPTIFGPLSLAGIILNALGWILLGLDVATRRRASDAQPQEVRPQD